MTQILALHSSPQPAGTAITRRLSALLVERLLRERPGATVVERDLNACPPAHVGADLFIGARRAAGERTTAEAHAVAAAELLIAELFDADILVIGAPMYNFGVPSVLKSWIDHVSLAGRTFRYGTHGAVHGLVTGKRAYVVTSRGGDYGDAGTEAGNFADPHLCFALKLLGIVDIEVIAANWQSLHPEARRDGLDMAERRILELTAR